MKYTIRQILWTLYEIRAVLVKSKREIFLLKNPIILDNYIKARREEGYNEDTFGATFGIDELIKRQLLKKVDFKKICENYNIKAKWVMPFVPMPQGSIITRIMKKRKKMKNKENKKSRLQEELDASRLGGGYQPKEEFGTSTPPPGDDEEEDILLPKGAFKPKEKSEMSSPLNKEEGVKIKDYNSGMRLFKVKYSESIFSGSRFVVADSYDCAEALIRQQVSPFLTIDIMECLGSVKDNSLIIQNHIHE